MGSVWDYGPMGVELKRNIKDAWWNSFVSERADVVGLDAAILMNPRTWVASGHADSFSDPLAECPNCHRRYRLDSPQDARCPNCDAALSEPRQFNLMLETSLGPVKDDASKVFLRPETAQGIFVNFVNVVNAMRIKPPFGIAQTGKAFRNEITPGNFIFRTREFEQMELEFFSPPQEAPQWQQYWQEFSIEWFVRYGIRRAKIRFEEHAADKIPHYAASSGDVQFEFPWGWGELETVSNRTDHDLKAHSRHSGKDLEYFDSGSGTRYTPHVVEPSMGVDRTAMAFMLEAYDEEQTDKDVRTVMRFHPRIAPFQAAVLPLSRNEKLVPTAKRVFTALASSYKCQYDDSQSIGRRYRRQDEVGTPCCITVDFDTVEKDDSVTIRNRDSMQQVRVPISNAAQALSEQLAKMEAQFEGGQK